MGVGVGERQREGGQGLRHAHNELKLCYISHTDIKTTRADTS